MKNFLRLRFMERKKLKRDGIITIKRCGVVGKLTKNGEDVDLVVSFRIPSSIRIGRKLYLFKSRGIKNERID